MSQTKAQLLDGKSATIQFTGGSASAPSVSFTGDTNTGIYSPGADQVAISTNGTGRLFVDSSGRILAGVSSTSVTATAVLQGNSFSSTAASVLFLSRGGLPSVASDGLGLIRFGDNSQNYGAQIQAIAEAAWTAGASYPSALAFWTTASGTTGAAERLRITSAGLVGVGTSSPSATLYVNNASGVDPSLTYGATAGQTFKNGTTELAFGAATTAPFAHWMQARFSTNAAQPLLLNPLGGNVGIGTTSPSELFHVAGNARIGANDTSAAQLEVGAGATGNRNSYIDLIGDTTYTDYGFRLIRLGGANNNTVLRHRGTGEFASITEDAAPLTFYTSNSERLRITSAGLVGVGTSSPYSKLTVLPAVTPATPATANQITVGEQTGNSAYRLQVGYLFDTLGRGSIQSYDNNNPSPLILNGAGGNVGIGTTSPQSSFHVQQGSDGEIARFQRSGGTNIPILRLNLTESTKTAEFEYTGADASGNIAFRSGGSERARIDTSGRLLVGTSSAAQYNHFSNNIRLQIAGTDSSTSSVQLTSFENSVFAANLILSKSRSGTIGVNTIVQNGDRLGTISFNGADGSGFPAGAIIEARIDGTPSANDLPTRLEFSTTADGASSPTERVRITNGGALKVTTTGSNRDSTSLTHELVNNVANNHTLAIQQNSTAYTEAAGGMLLLNCATSASSSWFFGGWYSGNIGDREFTFRGDGNAFADGSWSGGGADYAEYFEWSDSNPDAEDRRGISVVLDGDKIREAVAGEDPIGVISGNPSVVGDAAWNKWSGKYLRDEFGTYIQEDYEVADDDGNTVIQQRRKLNPAYDPDVEYISREQRPEWDCVGLMGKLRIRKGQVTGSRWIKMRDISATVEEWLVR